MPKCPLVAIWFCELLFNFLTAFIYITQRYLFNLDLLHKIDLPFVANVHNHSLILQFHQKNELEHRHGV